MILQPTRHSKLEKADILEMTVKHLQQIQRQQLSSAVATDPAVLTKFRSGFSECANEVNRYVNHLENVDPSVKQRLVSHLNNCVTNLQQVSPFYNHYVPYMPERLYPEVKVGFQTDLQNGGDENNNNNNSSSSSTGSINSTTNNNNTRIQIPSNVQLIPSRLPTGELALLVPPSANIGANFPFFSTPSVGSGDSTTSNTRIGTPSAFTAVQRTHSPLLSPSTSTSSFDDGNSRDHGHDYPASLSPPITMTQQTSLRFRMPEQSPIVAAALPSSSLSPGRNSYSSPSDTQKPQISSSSDRSSPPNNQYDQTRFETNCSPSQHHHQVLVDEFGVVTNNSRQPLSVITDKYNRTTTLTNALPKRDNKIGSKRRSDSDMNGFTEKRPRYHQHHHNHQVEPFNSSIGSTTASSSASRHSPSDSMVKVKEEFSSSSGDELTTSRNESIANQSTTTTTNSDMWRPW